MHVYGLTLMFLWMFFLFLLVKYRLTWNKYIRCVVQIIYGVFKLTSIPKIFPYLILIVTELGVNWISINAVIFGCGASWMNINVRWVQDDLNLIFLKATLNTMVS